jgi:hypothetical protein
LSARRPVSFGRLQPHAEVACVAVGGGLHRLYDDYTKVTTPCQAITWENSCELDVEGRRELQPAEIEAGGGQGLLVDGADGPGGALAQGEEDGRRPADVREHGQPVLPRHAVSVDIDHVLGPSRLREDPPAVDLEAAGLGLLVEPPVTGQGELPAEGRPDEPGALAAVEDVRGVLGPVVAPKEVSPEGQLGRRVVIVGLRGVSHRWRSSRRGCRRPAPAPRPARRSPRSGRSGCP